MISMYSDLSTKYPSFAFLREINDIYFEHSLPCYRGWLLCRKIWYRLYFSDILCICS